MEHFKSPFETRDFEGSRAIDNHHFFDSMLDRAKNHRFFSHPFMSTFAQAPPSPELVSFILTSFYKIVSPFTGLLCSLGGQAPTLRSRFALMDNIYEEMGCGDLDAAHPSLYLKMLASIGVTADAAESMPTLPAIVRINDHLREVVDRRHFAVACAVLASAEATIPPSFPILAAMARRSFGAVDMDFFDRHGPRDEGHSDDAAMLFAINADSSHFAQVEAEVKLDLDFRSELFDEWMAVMTNGVAPRRSLSERPLRSLSERPHRSLSERPQRPLSVRPMANHDSVPPPA
jgi:pyrroloquinoline quinone (PQQ) biosynthesis protein C